MGLKEFFGNKFCPNCKQNVHPTKSWLGVAGFGIFSFVVYTVAFTAMVAMHPFFGTVAAFIWLGAMGSSIFLPFNTHCPLCKTGWSELKAPVVK